MLHVNTLIVRPALALAAVSAALSFAAPAMAAPTAAAPTVLVRLDAADLNAGATATTIHHRLAAAARKVCSAEGSSLQEKMDARQCYAQTIRSAELQLVAQREQAKGRQQVFAAAQG